MKASVLLLLALLAVASASLQDIVEKSSQFRKVSLASGPLTHANLRKKRDLSVYGTLQWVQWPGSLPNGAVSIYNSYSSRTDYVCKHNCETGFYNPSMGSYCHYAWGDKEHSTSDFEILINGGHFETLEWKSGSWGSVPANSVNACHDGRKYVGKNKYGLGKVDTRHEAFFLPWEGSEYFYKDYEVLTIRRDRTYTQRISDVRYTIDYPDINKSPPETMANSVVTNNACQEVTKKVTLEKTVEKQATWSISEGSRLGVTGSITASILFISTSVTVSAEETRQFTRGNTVVESHKHSVSVELIVPPNHHCTARMEGRKMTVNIPYTGRLTRTYSDGETKSTSITGTYYGVQYGEIRAVVDRCEPVDDAQPCP